MRFQPILNIIFQIFLGRMPPDPPRSPKNFFLAAAWLQKVFRIDFSPKQKLLDRTLFSVGKQSCHEWKAKKFMEKCLQSTWRELGVAGVKFFEHADCELSWNQLAFS